MKAKECLNVPGECKSLTLISSLRIKTFGHHIILLSLSFHSPQRILEKNIGERRVMPVIIVGISWWASCHLVGILNKS